MTLDIAVALLGVVVMLMVAAAYYYDWLDFREDDDERR